MQTLWTFKTKNFTVTWAIEPCQHAIDSSWDETGETAEKLASGQWEAFDSRVAVFYRGQMIGADYLGESIYENPRDFRDHIGMNAKGHGSYFSDMVRGAIAEARKHLAQAPKMRAGA